MKKVSLIVAGLLIGATYAVAVPTSTDGTQLYKNCASCHGLNGEKRALGVSEILKDMSFDQLIDELGEHREQNSHGPKGKIMDKQVKGWSDAQLNAVAKYIKTFK